jgi:tetratricopeptide (TPR) repeat protein
MRDKRRPVGPRWIGIVIFVVMVTGLLLLNRFHPGVESEAAAPSTAMLIFGWIAFLLILFALIVIGGAIYVWLKRDPVIFRAYRIAQQEGRPNEALEMLRRKMQTRPKAVRAAAMGWILSGADRHAEAVKAFTVAEEMEPRTVIYSVERAVAMSKIGQGEAALAHLGRLRQQNPTEGGYALATAAVLDEMGRPAEAREEFRRAEDLLAKHPRAFHAQHTISFLRSRLAQRVGRDGATGLKAELERAFAQRSSGPATISRDAADDPEANRRGTG